MTKRKQAKNKYVTDDDYAQCIKDTPRGELPDCFAGWAFVNLDTLEVRELTGRSMIPDQPGRWIIADADEVAQVHLAQRGLTRNLTFASNSPVMQVPMNGAQR